MAIKILQEGKNFDPIVEPDQRFTGKCEKCGVVIECRGDDKGRFGDPVRATRLPHNGCIYYALPWCPTADCGIAIYLEPLDLIELTPVLTNSEEQ